MTCAYCSNATATWSTPEGKQICFSCLRRQRDDYRDQCERQAEEIRARREEEGAGYQQALKDCYHLLEDARARILAQLGGEP